MTKAKKKHGSALITGAGQRIGRAIALKLASHGYSIAIHYNRSKREALTLASDIKKLGVDAAIFGCDLTDSDDTQDLMEQVFKKFPSLNILINNASAFEKSDLKNYDLESFYRNLEIHLQAPYILTAELARRKSSGHIINILDAHIVQHKTPHFDYLLSKKALAEFTKMAAVSLAPKIRVNGIAPGPILSPVGGGNLGKKILANRIPLKRQGSIENITQTIEFLLHNSYITGEIIFVDGGEHLL
jgi:NAD(P)-dependent dehydrogenase (short-subunit alcohol dehydrogenase family)